MVIRIEGDSVSISANAVEAPVKEFTPPSGKTYEFLEIALQSVGAGYFRVYFNTVLICDKIEKDALAIDSSRILVDWKLSEGDKISITL